MQVVRVPPTSTFLSPIFSQQRTEKPRLATGASLAKGPLTKLDGLGRFWELEFPSAKPRRRLSRALRSKAPGEAPIIACNGNRIHELQTEEVAERISDVNQKDIRRRISERGLGNTAAHTAQCM